MRPSIYNYLLFFFFTLLFHTNFRAVEANFANLKDPNLTERCKNLILERKKKTKLKQKARGLLTQSEKLLKKTPSNKKSVSEKLQFIISRLHQEETLLELKIQTIEEKIVLSGCPGVILTID